MHEFESFDWSQGSEEEQLAMARKGTDTQLRDLARDYDWKLFPERLLGWIMAQKSIDLGTALTVFLNGEPELFNYLPKRDVPSDFRGAARVLDNICLRVNSGFYLVYPGIDVCNRKRVETWISYQQADRTEGRSGRWILDENILETLLEDTLRLDRSNEPEEAQRPSFLREVFSPVIELVARPRDRFRQPPS